MGGGEVVNFSGGMSGLETSVSPLKAVSLELGCSSVSLLLFSRWSSSHSLSLSLSSLLADCSKVGGTFCSF